MMGVEQLVDVEQFDAFAGVGDEVEIVVLGVPDGSARRELADVEVVVLSSSWPGLKWKT